MDALIGRKYMKKANRIINDIGLPDEWVRSELNDMLYEFLTEIGYRGLVTVLKKAPKEI